MSGAPEPALVVARGARATEAELCDALDALEAQAREALDFARPIRVIVPSQSLRLHLSALLVRRAGRARLGVVVQTLFAVAREILERCGVEPPGNETLFPVLVREAAAREPLLVLAFGAFSDGYAPVVASVTDLLDAGLDPLAPPALGAVAGAPRESVDRARAVLRVAAAVARAAREHGVERTSDALRRAAVELERTPDQALPARAVLVHGFADATGAALELLRVVVQRRAAQVWLDAPPDPTAPGADDPGVAFADRFVARLAPPSRARAERSFAPAFLTLVEAAGTDAEVRAAAVRIAALLEAGAAPESIGIVARALEPYAIALRVGLDRLGIPFSGLDARAPRGAVGRRARALAELVESRLRTAADVWLDARGESLPEASALADLRVGLHALGAARVANVAELDAARVLGGHAALPLPVRRGLFALDDDAESDDAAPRDERAAGARARRRMLPGHALVAAIDAARDLEARFQSCPARAPLATRQRWLEELLRDALGWSEASREPLLRPLRAAAAFAGELSYEEFARLVATAARGLGRAPLGGSGGGVAVLDVTEARARTFEHLFVLGLARDVFPRAIAEDALLPDALRELLLPALPDLALKRRGHTEERYLFAQLLSASPRVTLLRQLADDDGRALPASPLLERVRLAGVAPEPERAPSLWSPASGGARPAFEHAIAISLRARRRDAASFAALLAAALDENAVADAHALAHTRAAVLDEHDPPLGTGAARAVDLGPYFGFIGARGADDPRQAEPFVTTLEGFARCPWRVFVEKLLRIEPLPDALDALPGFDARLVGSAVHGALERIALRALGAPVRTLAEALARPAVAVPWPEPAELDAIIEQAAEQALIEAGVRVHGFARALARRTRVQLECARILDWSGAPPEVLGVELSGTARIDPSLARIQFRADRVDRTGSGLRITDYKTGKPFSSAKQGETRAGHLRQRIGNAQLLQAAAYAWTDGVDDAEGRYAYLRAELSPDAAVARVQRSDAVSRELARDALRTALGGWEQGAFVPRLLDDDGAKPPRTCDYCAVSSACLQGDAGLRARLHKYLRAATLERERSGGAGAAARDPLEAALADVLLDLAPR